MTYNRFKQKLKDSRVILVMYIYFFKILFSLEPIIPMSFPIRLYYRISTGRKLDLENPEGFNEKLQWLKVYYRDPLYVKCTDKFSVREYVTKQGCSHTLNELYSVHNSVDEIDFEELPERFALKCTHGCATNIICDNKSELNFTQAKQKISKWLKKTTGTETGEKHYKYIEPRIITEKHIGNDDGSLPIDYKIYCFNGKPFCIAVYSDRDKVTLKTNRCYFDFNWKPLNIVTERFYTDPTRFMKPDSLEEMYQVAERLSAPFPFVRVDLYDYKGTVIFGELTFTPTGGLGKAFSEKANIEFGKMLKLPKKSINKNYI